MATQCNEDWQLTKKTVLERNCYMFNNSLMSDVAFTCEGSGKKFYAHIYVLATSTPVFYAMFYGDLAEKSSVIHLPDADNKSFEEFLRFLYTDQCTLTAEIALTVMYLAKKYMVPSLTEKCVEILRSSIKPGNVVAILEQAIHFDEKELEKRCWEIVDSETSKAVTSAAFNEISQAVLCSLLKRKTLNIVEIELFQAVLKWSDHQCLKNGLEATGDNRRSVIGDAVYEVHFLSMTQKEFAENVPLSGLLTAEEIVVNFQTFSGVEVPNLKWKQLKRISPTNLFKFSRFSRADIKPAGTNSGWWGYTSSKPDRLSCSVDKTAVFHGVRLFGDANGSKYEVSLEINGSKVTGTYTSELNNEGIYGFNVMLSTPLSVDQNVVVTMAALIKGPTSCFGENGKASVKVNETTVTFTTTDQPTNGTVVLNGQFHQIILSI